MLNFTENFKHVIVALGILLLALGTWYFFNNRQLKEAPDRADLVLYIDFVKNNGINYG